MIPSLYEKFKDYSKTGSVYIISDTHFDDEDCKLMNPDWIPPQEHIDKINQIVFKGDTLIHLGDVGNPKWLDKIKCKNRILIKGNHDSGSKNYEKYFKEIYEGPLFISDKILLSHEPVIGLKFCVNIHGHCHNGEMVYTDDFLGKHINLASDVVNFELFNLGKEIKKGLLSDIDSIHRLTIDRATLNPLHKKDISLPQDFTSKEQLQAFLDSFDYDKVRKNKYAEVFFIVSYRVDGQSIIAPIYFASIEENYFETPCMLSAFRMSQEDGELTNYILEMYPESADDEELFQSIFKFERSMIRGDYHYEISCPQTSHFLPDKIKILNALSEEDLVDYILNREKLKIKNEEIL